MHNSSLYDNRWEQRMNSPEFEFGQSSDERAELLVLLGGEGWTLICRGGGRQWVDRRMVQMNLLLSQQDDLYASKKNSPTSLCQQRTFIKQ